ncbi:MAG: phosphoglycerate mutase [Chloroflexi bacterium GWC2_73_18]|nr:MAG: phosphoglycerate mutase [Chloroflexi bacterium GWC2_73_18]
MTTVLLVRHGLTAQTGAILAGWTPGIHLDERGRRQAAALGERLRPMLLAAVVSSPLERCVETATALLDGRGLDLALDERLGEVRYGDWTGREVRQVAKDPLWKVIQAHASEATFPNGEALRETQARAVAAVRDWNDRLGRDATYLACSHADVLKAIVADALGLHLDRFQRIAIEPASLTVIRYGRPRPLVLRLNDVGGEAADLLPRRRRGSRGRALRPA